MNIKTGTTTYGKPSDSVRASDRDNSNNLSAMDQKEVLGEGGDVGDLLNKVADPNWVDPQKSVRKVGNNTLDKDAFLKLMLAQMKHQDPTNPQPSHEMAAQLAQFTSLEQLNNINSTLGNMNKAQQPQMNYQALNFIGKKVSGDSSKVLRIANDTKHDFNFNLSGDAAKISVKVLDGDGNLVRQIDNQNMKKGANTVTWNGMTDDGSAARPGEYRFVAEATSSNGGKLFAKTDFDGKISGMNFTPEGPVLLVGNQTIRMQDVKRIEEVPNEAPGMGMPLEAGGMQMLPGPQGQAAPIKKSPAQPQADQKVGKAVDAPTHSDIRKTVGMSSGMLDEVQQAMSPTKPESKPGKKI